MTTLNKRYSDLDYRFRKLASGDIAKIYDEDAINRSLYALFRTTRGERWFNLTYGTNIPGLLFEPFDMTTAQAISEEAEEAIRIWEGNRVQLISINVNLNYDTNSYQMTLKYNILSTTETGDFRLLLVKQ